MRIELSQTISQDERRSLGFPGVAQLLPGQPSHQILQDIRKFFGQIFAGSLATSPGPKQLPQNEAQCMPKWPAICFVKWHGTGLSTEYSGGGAGGRMDASLPYRRRAENLSRQPPQLSLANPPAPSQT